MTRKKKKKNGKTQLSTSHTLGEGTLAFSTSTAMPQCQKHLVVNGERQGSGTHTSQVAGAKYFAVLRAAAPSENAKERNEGEVTHTLEIGSRHHLLLKVMKLAWAMPRVFRCAPRLSLKSFLGGGDGHGKAFDGSKLSGPGWGDRGRNLLPLNITINQRGDFLFSL